VESGFVLDAAAMMDMRLSGLAIPPATLDAFRQGVVRLWLIPKGNEAFSLRDGYQRQDLFGQELRQVFNEHYKKIDEATCFEVWCFNHQTEDAIVK
jgi:hypothetical protein